MFFLKVNTHGQSLCISLFSWRNPKTTILLKRQVFTILTCFASKRLWCGENGANLATCYGLSSVVIGAFDCNWNIRIIHGIASPPHPIVTAVPSECISRFSGGFCLFPNLISISQFIKDAPTSLSSVWSWSIYFNESFFRISDLEFLAKALPGSVLSSANWITLCIDPN